MAQSQVKYFLPEYFLHAGRYIRSMYLESFPGKINRVLAGARVQFQYTAAGSQQLLQVAAYPLAFVLNNGIAAIQLIEYARLPGKGRCRRLGGSRVFHGAGIFSSTDSLRRAKKAAGT